jgi:dienelactone hydrolase
MIKKSFAFRAFFLVAYMFTQIHSIAYGQQNSHTLRANTSVEKPALDTGALINWPSVGQSIITKDGKYAGYTINEQVYNTWTIILQSIDRKWKQEIICSSSPEIKFSRDNKYCIIRVADTLKIVKLNSKKEKIFTGIQNYINSNGTEGHISYTYHADPETYHLIQLGNNDQKQFYHVKGFQFRKDGSVLLIEHSNGVNISLEYYDLKKNISKLIWTGNSIVNIVWHKMDDRFVFYGRMPDNDRPSLFQYYPSWDVAQQISDEVRLIEGYKDPDLVGWSSDSKRLFLKYDLIPISGHKTKKTSIQVWHYNDRSYESTMESMDALTSSTIFYTYDILSKTYRQLNQPTDNLKLFPGYALDTVALISEKNNTRFYLISTINGSKKEIDYEFLEPSPHGFFLIGGNTKNEHTIIRSNLTGKNYDVTVAVLDMFIQVDSDSTKSRSLTNIIWLPNDTSFLLSDGYDIWKIDPNGKSMPVNITGGYGFKNNITFSISRHQLWDVTLRPKNNKVILKATNLLTYTSGFYQCDLNNGKALEKLFMGPYTFGDFLGHPSAMGYTWSPDEEEDHFIISRNNIQESPNFFITDDFRHFSELSNFHPENKYNWLTSELLVYTTIDGAQGTAAMYKPENFDAHKKYPVIFYCYEHFTDKINEYHMPELSGGGINIPWFVSRGYIVCTPDINNVSGNPGESARHAVLGCYDILKTKSWVDTDHIGIAGHSFGGFETNYLLTTTNIFKAAYSGAGIADLVSFYNSWFPDNSAKTKITETGQINTHSTLWETKEKYIHHSAVYQANKIQSPLLLMNNIGDGSVPLNQGTALFLALKKMEKDVWLLNYRSEEHVLMQVPNQVDFTIKLTEFFDYYLKNKPAPNWMFNGAGLIK